MDDLVKRARAMAQGEARAGIGKVRRALFEALADEIERLREQHDLALRVHDAMAAKIERLRGLLSLATAELKDANERLIRQRDAEAGIERLREQLAARKPVDPFQDQQS